MAKTLHSDYAALPLESLGYFEYLRSTHSVMNSNEPVHVRSRTLASASSENFC